MQGAKKTVGIIGLGAFGVFMARHLSPYYRLLGCDRNPPKDAPEGLELAPPDIVAQSGIVVFAVPLDNLEEAARLAAPHIRPGALVVDVTSVKVRPLAILGEIIPEHADLLGTHPLFGPQSGKNGIASLRIALCRVRISSERYYKVCDFLTDSLRLLIIKTDPDSHDREMAKVQAMTHFLSRALRKIGGFEPSPMATKAYEKLQEFASIVLSDSWDLFLTIERGNAHADRMRTELLGALQGIEDELTKTAPSTPSQ